MIDGIKVVKAFLQVQILNLTGNRCFISLSVSVKHLKNVIMLCEVLEYGPDMNNFRYKRQTLFYYLKSGVFHCILSAVHFHPPRLCVQCNYHSMH